MLENNDEYRKCRVRFSHTNRHAMQFHNHNSIPNPRIPLLPATLDPLATGPNCQTRNPPFPKVVANNVYSPPKNSSLNQITCKSNPKFKHNIINHDGHPTMISSLIPSLHNLVPPNVIPFDNPNVRALTLFDPERICTCRARRSRNCFVCFPKLRPPVVFSSPYIIYKFQHVVHCIGRDLASPLIQLRRYGVWKEGIIIMPYCVARTILRMAEVVTHGRLGKEPGYEHGENKAKPREFPLA